MSEFSSIIADYGIEKTPVVSSEFSSLIPEEERGFTANIAESWKRGKEQILSDIAVYEAMKSETNLEDALRLRKKFQRQELVDPVEGNFLEQMVYKTSKILPGWFESAKAGVKPGLIGAGAGAGIAFVAGQLGPQVALPEEIATVPAGAIFGFKKGFTLGSAHFWYKQGAGSMFAEMVEKGYDPQKSAWIAEMAAIPYAALEFLQIKTVAGPLFRKGLGEVAEKTAGQLMRNIGKTYLTTLGKEIGEEVAQEAIQIAAEDIASYASDMGVDLDKDWLKDRSKRLGSVAWESLQAMALLPIPATGIDAVNQIAQNQAIKGMKAEESRQNWEGLTGETYGDIELGAGAEDARNYQFPADNVGYNHPVDILSPSGKIIHLDYSIKGQGELGVMPKDPLGRLQFALMNSIEKYVEMKKIHKKELATKFALSEAALFSSESAIEGYKKSLGQMKGELTKLNIDPVDSYLSGQEWEELFDEIRNSNRLPDINEKRNLMGALYGLKKEGKLMTPSEIKLLEKQFGPSIAQAMKDVVDVGKDPTFAQKVAQWMGLAKATAASMDLSLVGRQDVLLIGRPKHFLKALESVWKVALADEATAKQLEMEAYTSDYAHLARQTVLRRNKWGTQGTYETRAEKFPTPLPILRKIPFYARAERAFVAGGNLLRMWLFEQYAREWENDVNHNWEIREVKTKKGETRSETLAEAKLRNYNDLAHIINLLTGEGDAKLFGEYAQYLNAAFFAPRLLSARFQAIFEVFNPKRSWAARKILAHHLVRFVVCNSLILTALSQVPGVDVEPDPRSTDFGKAKIGNTRIDLWGGYQPIARLVMELILGQHKTQAGEVIDTKWMETVSRFLQTKLAPVPSAAIDFMRGETFYGQEVKLDTEGILNEVYNKMTPLFFQDVVDAVHYQGLGTAALIAPLAFHGIGTQTYDQNPSAKLTTFKNRVSREVFGRKWSEVGSEAQKVLREYFPEIEKQEQENKYEYQSPKYVERLIKEEYESEKRIKGSLSKSIQKELDLNKIRIGGLGRRIGSDWYLNDKRFKQYEDSYIKIMNKVLPSIFTLPKWDSITLYDKQVIVGTIAAKAKDYIRKGIVGQANIEDIQYLWEKQRG